MGCHLRFGFEATYGRDTSLMRNDNVADYPWLCFSLATLMDEFQARMRGQEATLPRSALVESMLNGMAADPRAFLGAGPASLAAHEVERGRFREQFLAHQPRLIDEFERFQPSPDAYSPLSFFFNFSHNVVKGQVVDSLVWSLPWPAGLSDLFTSAARDETPGALARDAGADTDRLRAHQPAQDPRPAHAGDRLRPRGGVPGIPADLAPAAGVNRRARRVMSVPASGSSVAANLMSEYLRRLS